MPSFACAQLYQDSLPMFLVLVLSAPYVKSGFGVAMPGKMWRVSAGTREIRRCLFAALTISD